MPAETRRFGFLRQDIDPKLMTPEDVEAARAITGLLRDEGFGPAFGEGSIRAKINQNLNMLSIDVTMGVLDPPFHRGIHIDNMIGAKGHTSQQAMRKGIVPALRRLTEQPLPAVDDMRKVVEKLERTIRGSGMKLISYRPVACGVGANTGPNMVVLARISHIDETLTETISEFVLCELHYGFRDLGREVAAQRRRLPVMKNGLIVDAILHQALTKMTSLQQAKLVECLRHGRREGTAGFQEWTRSQLAKDHGVALPECIETIRAKDGLVTGRVRLAPTITFNRNTLQVAGLLAESLLTAIPGRSLRGVVEHPWIPEVPVLTVDHHPQGRTKMRIDPPMIMYPSGIPVPRQELQDAGPDKGGKAA